MKSVLGLGGIKFWGRERDPLLEQTLSFVQGIAASKPPERVQDAGPQDPEPPARMYTDFMMSERADFQRRVREFRARQQKIRQGREEYYSSVWQKTRATLGNAIEGSAL
jgi:hypothetical protein